MLCPTFRFFSIVFLLSWIETAVFFTELTYGGINNSSLLAAEPATLTLFGNKDPYLIRYEYEAWRFVTPIFLHANIAHLLSNVIGQLMIGSQIENDIGSLRFLVLYLMSGIGGILFSAMCDNGQSCGASTSIYGLIGSYAAFLIINWSYLKNHTDRRCSIIIYLIFALLLGVLIAAAVSQSNLTQHSMSMYLDTLVDLSLVLLSDYG